MGLSEEEIRAAYVGGAPRLSGRVVLVEYDPAWPGLYEREAARIRAVLGGVVVGLAHVGSTSVPGLAAKPIVDVVLTVADSADEGSYVPALEAAGYVLRIREPGWLEHRMFKGPDTDVNLHVFTAGEPEVARMLAFRDRLRVSEEDRRLYEGVKRGLAARDWEYLQQYADAKAEVVADILGRA
ncbi:GrpB family protein [Saccharothrix sp. S26]|uniref:GrpB family protein n=1 Tax=Saccharothrix sp. S26 TaxID=2907215 RepID=UPI001F4715B3|nr:GrpB family protein [Saccharothrix sp. S26]MCE6997582.1 GrpB family protein [Saccharothrix sp. S26]